MANLLDVPPSPSDAALEQVCMARTLRVDSPSLSRSWLGQVPHGLGVGPTPWTQECHRFPSGVNEAALLGGVLLIICRFPFLRILDRGRDVPAEDRQAIDACVFDTDIGELTLLNFA